VPHTEVCLIRINTSLGPMVGSGTSSIQSPGLRYFLTRAFMRRLSCGGFRGRRTMEALNHAFSFYQLSGAAHQGEAASHRPKQQGSAPPTTRRIAQAATFTTMTNERVTLSAPRRAGI